MESEEPHTMGKGCKNIFSMHCEGLIILLPPIIFLPVMFISDDMANKCMYVLLIMIVYWISEVIPLGVTSMLPILCFPVMGIMSTNRACQLYFRDTLVMFVTSMMVATAIEYSKLHIRLALRVLQVVGCSPRRLHFGVCFTTMFMSIWIANSACTAMMCPIVYAVLDELGGQGLIQQYHEDDGDLPKNERRPSKIALTFYLSVAYCSSIGGCGSLIGTPTNLAFKGIYESRFPHAEETIEFTTFSLYTMPSVLVSTLLLYLDLQIFYMGLFRPNSPEAKEANIGPQGDLVGRGVINRKYDELGPISVHEISVAILFCLLITLYIMKTPGFMTGWADLFEQTGIKNSAPTCLILILLFTLPANYKFLKFWDAQSLQNTPPLLTWSFVVPKIPWGLIFLVGGGSTLAEGSKVSGMATKLGKSLLPLGALPGTFVILFSITVCVLMTNFSANVAICNITVPVLIEMAVAMKLHPLYLVYSAGLGCSMAFMLPVGTPPNAIVQGYANIDSKDMIKGGFFPSVTTILVLWISSLTWSIVVYPSMTTYPDWADLEVEPEDEERSLERMLLWL